jgi:hypothetical protein
MKVLPLHPEIKAYLKARQLEKKFEKQLNLFKENPFHRSKKQAPRKEPI